ncbi:solute carrier family 12 member 6 isoform X3 [Anthonomus grandis grandis]|uniref:solute carrier family 12 member 6 isoform X3 n=1 Tax=Anthonomus grandis grandis TaxID=2921223 RepID=UPI002166765A|nr:solute carrier family 12 member 6 isoform X3 [Anthonomus grandis grandis]
MPERFKVSRAEDPNNYNSFSDNTRDEGNSYNSYSSGRTEDQRIKQKLLPDPSPGHDEPFDLYYDTEDEHERPRITTFVQSLANYSNTIPPISSDPDAPPQPAKSAQMGTLIGVYLPCIQNIFGVILFIRLTWVVGTAGAIFGFMIVLTCCCVTMLTAISMSAIATNGVVPAGGSYFMISRSIGPEFGGAVGMLFYTGTTLAASMYIVGAVEIVLVYMAPSATLLGSISDDEVKFNNFRIYGTCLLLVMGTIVFVGVKFVNKFAAVALACVLLSIVAVYVGIFMNFHGNDKLQLCVLGRRVLKLDSISECHKFPNGTLYNDFCRNGTCDSYWKNENLTIERGIKGLASGVFFENIHHSFLEQGQFIAKGNKPVDVENVGTNNYAQIINDITTSFTILIGIFFPSVTGIMAGSNRSGDLKDAQKSIPIGTICAILTTSTVYLSSVLLFAGTVDNLLLRDKFGSSIGGKLVVANIAWPNQWVILIGSFLSTLGAGLQSLTGAPRLLQAIAKDEIIPFLRPFAVSSSRGEPTRALILTLLICECGILLGNVDILAPLLSMFFLMCYGFVNLACALQTLLRTPNWRPRFKYYHWVLSFLGLSLCIAVMFMTSWYLALLAMGMAGIIYKYIEYRGAEKEWGDGIRGLALSAARYSLLRLEEGPPHTKNWRPQILLLVKLTPDLELEHRKYISLISQLKAGRGLTICASVIRGELPDKVSEALKAKQTLKGVMDKDRVKGFAEILVAKHVSEGLCNLVQTAGLGGLKPNTVILSWPYFWREDTEEEQAFENTVRTLTAAKMALLIPRGIDFFPDNTQKVNGNIDIWWIVHDGGLLMLIPFLLKQHRTWKNCKLRIFTVAQFNDNNIQMKKDLKKFLYQLRIEAEVEVVEMSDKDISAYANERTLLMEQRTQMLRELHLNKKESMGMTLTNGGVQENISLVQSVVDQHHSIEKTPSKVRFEEAPKSVSNNTDNKKDNDLEENRREPSNEPNANEDCENNINEKEDGASEKESLKEHGDEFSKDLSFSLEADTLRRLHTAMRLNETIRSMSKDSQLVILNLPSPPKNPIPGRQTYYLDFLEVLSEGMEKVLMVRGGGQEVITIYS